MRNYIFLDNWALSNYTKDDKQELLSTFIHRNHYTIIINSISFTEMFNPGWQGAKTPDRTIRAMRFLSHHPCVFIYPHTVFKAEIDAFPNRLHELPIDLDLEAIPSKERLPTLLSFLRGDEVFVMQGKDIRQWAKTLNELKANWLNDVGHIIERACENGTLVRDKKGRFKDLQPYKEKFLAALDRRHFDPEQIRGLGPQVINLFLDETAKLRAVRMNSLCFWYAYVDEDKSFPTKKSGSDIVDFYQISLIPYCAVFTVDNPMFRLVTRILSEVGCSCEVLNPSSFNAKLESFTHSS